MTSAETESDDSDHRRSIRRRLAICVLSLGTGLVAFDSGTAAVALPTISAVLRISQPEAALVVTVYQLVLAITVLPLSELSGRLGYRRTFGLGMGCFGLGAGFSLFVGNLTALIAVRSLQALGAACVLSVSSAMTRQLFPEERLGRGFALTGTIIAGATAIAPIVSGLLLEHSTWRMVFAITLPFSVLLLLSSRLLPPGRAHARPFDLLGAALCAGFLGLLLLGLDLVSRQKPAGDALSVVAASLFFGTAFAWRSLNHQHPILPIDLLGRPIVAWSVGGSFLAFLSFMLVMLTLPFRLQSEMGFAPAEVGHLLAPWPIAMLVVSPVAAALSDRFHPGILGTVGMVAMSLGIAAIALIPDNPSYWEVAWPMGLGGGGFGVYLAPNAKLIVSGVPAHRAANAGGLITTNRLVAQSVGAGLAAYFLSMAWGGATMAIALAGAFSIIGAGFSFARIRTH